MVIEIAAGSAALAVVVLVAFLIPLLVRLQRSAAELDRLLRRLNDELPIVLREAQQTTQNLNLLTSGVLRGAALASALAIGARAGVLRSLNGWRAGLRTGLQVFKRRRYSGQQKVLPRGE
jgi:Bacterial protein of unknown function (DUF948)